MSSNMNADDKKRYDSWVEAQRELRPDETVLDRLGLLRSMQRSNWHLNFTRDAKEEIVIGAVMPLACKSEDAWEARAMEMHEAQEPIELEAKPLGRERLRSGEGVAEFHLAYVDETPKNFADMPEEERAAFLNKTKRKN